MTNSSEMAKSCLRELVMHVFRSSPETLEGLTYQELARRIGRLNKHSKAHAHGMGKVLGDMGHLLQDLEGDWGEPIAHIQSLVVSKSGHFRGLPDEGIKEFWRDYPNLTALEKVNKVRAEYLRIAEFGSRWNRVLLALDLPAVLADEKKSPVLENHFRHGGESPQHLALKEYVFSHPEIVGADSSYEAFMEYVLPSLDCVDVLFNNPKDWIAVEVKSRVSDNLEQDYERGLYQCVKYRALIEAMKNDPNYNKENIRPTIQIILLLESSLPPKYKLTAQKLCVRIIEKVTIKGNGK